MTPAAQSVFDRAKAGNDEFCAVDATHLTPSERRELAEAGLSFTTTRKRGQIVASYPAHMRQADFRAAVLAKRSAKG